MFSPDIYSHRRQDVANGLSGIILIPGNSPSPVNYKSNTYPFIQDSNFRYFFGLNEPDMFGVLDADSGQATLFAPVLGIEDTVWFGPLPPIYQRAKRYGVERVESLVDLDAHVASALAGGRPVHYLPPYQDKTRLDLTRLLRISPYSVEKGSSAQLISNVIRIREIKTPQEVAQMEASLAVAAEMHRAAMLHARPGVYEREVVAQMEHVYRRIGLHPAYPPIFTRRGEVLHKLNHDGLLQAGDLVVNDAGVISDSGYASDITRTLPIGGKFDPLQLSLYVTVLDAQMAAIAWVAPGISFVDIHKYAATIMVERLIDHGLFKGNPQDVVESGAYAICFQCGLGHQIGLDVHDMESLGEDNVGYGPDFMRSELFGLKNLRLAKKLKSGMTVTVEPGLYFIPQQISMWGNENRYAEFIDYDRFRDFEAFGGIRIEDVVLVTEQGGKVLGPPIPKEPREIEALMASQEA